MVERAVRLLKFAISLVVWGFDALRSWLDSLKERFPEGKLVVLYYHTITPETRNVFARHLDNFLLWGKPLSAAREIVLKPGERYFAITFDDAFASFLQNGFPELKKRLIPAVLFVPVGWLGQNANWNALGDMSLRGEKVMTCEELSEACKSDVLVMGSHGLKHVDLRRLDEGAAWKELIESKRILEEIVGYSVTTFSFPYGYYGERDVLLAHKAGYSLIYSTEAYSVEGKLGPGLVGRVGVDTCDTNIELKLKFEGAYRWLPIASHWKRKIIKWVITKTSNGKL